MTVHLKISGDPITWTAADDSALTQAEDAVNSGTTIVLDVVEPLAGRLVLCGRNVSAVTALTIYPTGGWVPSHYFFTASVAPVEGAPGPRNPGSPFAYLLGDGASDHGPLGYPLRDDADLAAIEEQVLAALAGGTTTEIAVGIPSQPGSVVVNGAVLGGVVLVPASPDAAASGTGSETGSQAASGAASDGGESPGPAAGSVGGAAGPAGGGANDSGAGDSDAGGSDAGGSDAGGSGSGGSGSGRREPPARGR